MPIEIQTFEEWDASQDPNEIKEYGSSGKDYSFPLQSFEKPYRELSENIKKIFYQVYVHNLLA